MVKRNSSKSTLKKKRKNPKKNKIYYPDLHLLYDIDFQCESCERMLSSQEILATVEIYEEEIRKKESLWIAEVEEEDKHEAELALLESDIALHCPYCHFPWKVQVHFTAPEGIGHQFYFSDIAGCRPYLPFQVMTGARVKDIVGQFFFRWLSDKWQVHIVTPYFDDVTLEVLGSVSRKVMNSNRYSGSGRKPLVITREKSIYYEHKSGEIVLLERFDRENCENCPDKRSALPVCDFCFKWEDNIDVVVPKINRKHFHAKWYAGIKADRVELIISSHNLGAFENPQPQTIGLIQLNAFEYQTRFLDQMNLKGLIKDTTMVKDRVEVYNKLSTLSIRNNAPLDETDPDGCSFLIDWYELIPERDAEILHQFILPQQSPDESDDFFWPEGRG